jgi:hypothetical protein
MIPPHRRSLRALIVFMLCVGSQLAIVSVPTPTSQQGCESLRRWARQFEGRSVSLEEIARFDRGHRLAIFNAIPAATRADLWREQLRRFANYPNLSDAQRRFIRDTVEIVTPARYEAPRAVLAAAVNSTIVAGENLTVGSTVWLPAESVAPGR